MAVTINGTTGIITPDIGVDGTTLTIDSVNNLVGIGTDSPTNAALHVAGRNLSLGGPGYNSSGESNLYLGDYNAPANNTYDPNIRVGTRDEFQFEIESDYGNGTRSNNVFFASPTAVGLNVYGDSSSPGQIFYYNYSRTAADQYMSLSVGGSPRLRITGDGKVGIGTATPTASLSVYNDSSWTLFDIKPSASDRAAAIIFRPAGTVSSSNTEHFIGKRHTDSDDGKLHFWRYDGTSHLTSNLTIDSAGDVNVAGGNLFVGVDTATLNFTNSVANSNTKFVEIGSQGGGSGGDAYYVVHSSGSGVGYFGYEAGGDRLVVACDSGSGNNKIDFITDAGTTTGGNTDNVESKVPKMRITADGKVGIGTTNPNYMLDVQAPNPGNDSKTLIQEWSSNNQNTLELNMYGGSVDQIQFAAINSEQRMSFCTGTATGSVSSGTHSLYLTEYRDAWLQGLGSSVYGGAVFIGSGADPSGSLCALRDSNRRPMLYLGGKYPEITLSHEVPTNASHGPTIRFATYVQSSNTATGSQFVIGTNGSGTFLDIGHATAAQNANVHNGIASYNGTHRFRVTTSGCQVNGSLSKSSGSFRIDHPLESLTETHDLVHSFIEGPQADLIYRGKVDLIDGSATVNIDEVSDMTDGTFVVLCREVQCFTSNETGWTAVRGYVTGNILTIESQDNTSTDTISWLVVGERKDPHMYDTEWTDENGKIIVEPERPPVEEVDYSITENTSVLEP